MKSPYLQTLESWYQANYKQILQDFFSFLSFSSISTDPHYKQDIEQTAEWLKKYLEKIGLKTEIWPTEGHPVVFASSPHIDPKKPTLLIYHHYDVQPVDPYDQWRTCPFDPEIKEDIVYARGASDNKGQCFFTLSAIKAYIENSPEWGFNLKLFIEGEEECGSKNSSSLLPEKKQELEADYLLIVDMALAEAGVPAITLGLRGLVTMEVSCTNARADLHSGIFGGLATNPNHALIQALSRCWNEKGEIVIEGFYDEVLPLFEQEKQSFDRSISKKELAEKFGIRAFPDVSEQLLWEKAHILPTLEINGIGGGYTGKGFKTIIPSVATAKISCRLVPNQDPEVIVKKVEQHLKKWIDSSLDLTLTYDHGAPPVRSSADTAFSHLVASAFETVFSSPCHKLLAGGSVPIVPKLTQISGAELAMIGLALAEDDAHAPNEHFSMQRFFQGFLVMSTIFSELSTQSNMSSFCTKEGEV